MAALSMDWQKNALIGGIAVIIFLLIFRWNAFEDNLAAVEKEQRKNSVAETLVEIPTEEPSNTASNEEIPLVNTDSETPVVAIAQTVSADRIIEVKTDTLHVWIDLQGGDIVKVSLPQYKVELDGSEEITLLNNEPGELYIAQSGLVSPKSANNIKYIGTDNAGTRPLFTSNKTEFSLNDGDDSLTVELNYENNGVSFTKQFTFTRNQYLINLRYLVNNQSGSDWKASFYGKIKRGNQKPDSYADSGFGVNPFVGAATTTIEENYKKFNFDELDELKDSESTFSRNGGWVAMVQHYFTSAWVANPDEKSIIFLKKSKLDNYLLGYTGPLVSVPSGTTGEITSRFYVGPKDIDKLEKITPYLDLTIDFGFLWWIAKPIFYLLDFLHGFIGNWGWSIIVLTILIKAIFFYPSAISYRSMAKMRKLGPKMQSLKERHGDDRQKMSQEMMKLYKTEKVNPMSGCLPIIIQMPVFISLYWVLMESVEIRHAPFMLWIQDLSVMDPYLIFPLLMGATMFIQQKLNPTPPDPMQAKLMQWMPIMFTFMFLWFPAGLVIYWVTNNTLSIAQQYLITRSIEQQKS